MTDNLGACTPCLCIQECRSWWATPSRPWRSGELSMIREAVEKAWPVSPPERPGRGLTGLRSGASCN